jgi:hypothetical protein
MHLQPHMYLMLSILGVLLSGCAVHYYDSETQTEHVWGVGHMMLKASVPKEGLKATVRGTALSGVSIGLADQGRQGYGCQAGMATWGLAQSPSWIRMAHRNLKY